MLDRLCASDPWHFFGVLPQADRALAIGWWSVLVLRGLLPALFAVAMGKLVGAVQGGDDLGLPLALVGVAFVLLQVLSPIHQTLGENLGCVARPTDRCGSRGAATRGVLFGLADWTVERFRTQRRRLHDLQWQATRLRERPLVWSLLLVLAANLAVFGALGGAAANGDLALDRLVTFATAASVPA